MNIIFNEIKVNDLLLVEKSFYCTPLHPNDSKKNNYSGWYEKKINKESIILILENNFGSTYKERYVRCLLDNRQFYFNNNSSLISSSHNMDDCFKRINK